jgi:hypothetical protein
MQKMNEMLSVTWSQGTLQHRPPRTQMYNKKIIQEQAVVFSYSTNSVALKSEGWPNAAKLMTLQHEQYADIYSLADYRKRFREEHHRLYFIE